MIASIATAVLPVWRSPMINQKGQNMTCIYVAIGQKASSIKNVVRALEANGAMEYTISASSPRSRKYSPIVQPE